VADLLVFLVGGSAHDIQNRYVAASIKDPVGGGVGGESTSARGIYYVHLKLEKEKKPAP
jgi:hypothetical protein